MACSQKDARKQPLEVAIKQKQKQRGKQQPYMERNWPGDYATPASIWLVDDQ